MTAADTWSVADAKARLSELLDTVGRDGPQTISRRGRPVAVVVSVDEWERRKRRQGTLAEFLATAPVGDEDLILERDRGGRMREVDL
ncbi:type II toxin-antitoxin system Phd/YefM family antitoxin [Jiangella rhizosphaerae]|uniref:Antitoxin n=1 Tax=Jiangella rhizosphaerae TaxID=2293569 RepID=A0A418KWW5_9ACTN|nr:type II toxin-antitoxin system Phd/YefM family antitoxin [Jiangella rhizosphaerae]RIQ36732.1 type II toxin-antitoxin system Phd/YefM family antitoxin [Jiangella rhizosphaerae]